MHAMLLIVLTSHEASYITEEFKGLGGPVLSAVLTGLAIL